MSTYETVHQFVHVGYQPHLRSEIEFISEKVFDKLGLQLRPDVLLVGALKPNEQNLNPVCVEPENGKWPLSLFTNLLADIESTVKDHPLQRVVYGDEPSMRDKPERICRDSFLRCSMKD